MPRPSGHWVPVSDPTPITVLSPAWKFLVDQHHRFWDGKFCLGKHKDLLAAAEHHFAVVFPGCSGTLQWDLFRADPSAGAKQEQHCLLQLEATCSWVKINIIP